MRLAAAAAASAEAEFTRDSVVAGRVLVLGVLGTAVKTLGEREKVITAEASSRAGWGSLDYGKLDLVVIQTTWTLLFRSDALVEQK
jgi:hypothetical protein